MTEILITSKTEKVYKGNKLNRANFGDYNLNDYQAFLQLVSKLGKVDALGKYVQPEKLERNHTLTAKEFSDTFNVELSHSYQALKRAAKRLSETSITIENIEVNKIQHIPICSISEYNTKSGNLSICFNDLIMPYLAQVKTQYVLYNLREVANFRSLYSTRLYELIQEFKDTGWVLKSVEQLRIIFAVGEKLASYKNFKARVLIHAVQEINNQYNLNLVLREIKAGKRVIAVKFFFAQTFTRKMIDPMTGNERNQYIKPSRKIKALPLSKQKADSQPVATKQQHKITQESNHVVEQKLEIHLGEPIILATTKLENAAVPETEASTQKEEILPIVTPQPALSNPPLQKKKRFFGLF